ncbi:Probable DnaJ-class molecular chaperone [Flavobacterium indicum GPTSA100-9 = DSM 17447]|uniref:Probable DnaJ-class molecular chaperone n=1 Tax=Flavobacterium indicum (strain DSM 17447 / CIP 109464 / GPTSA100-9) TaxID=1094466 RepID=H8XPU9_FLAIG|nr:KTSC domain-containing protein [Flavobacterium indicum]CCG54165.1 Probable DnaJ-class molecular chaperone [Flavobacterium indicum GPTSA100-9 = DSM 17447]
MNSKKIAEYRKLLNVTKEATLKELKTIYRNSMKEDHPDTISDPIARLAAEERSKNIIEAYHFLVSIAPETQEKVKETYEQTITTSNILDFWMEKGVLYINFLDGNCFEYFGVPKNVYIKMINAESPSRFARRHIYKAYLYRSASKLVAMD